MSQRITGRSANNVSISLLVTCYINYRYMYTLVECARAGSLNEKKFKLWSKGKRTLMIGNGASVLQELIASSNGKYIPYRIFSAQELKQETNNYDQKNGFWHESCINNVTYAAQMSHDHILKLIGCCLETPIAILHGTLWDRILGAPQTHFEPLLLKRRLKDAVDAANALAYLHFGFPRPIVLRFQDITYLVQRKKML
ncbi:hypothetical protein CUMW_199750 [Citrus unshiu]|nr:hypothetical protein CUMW_199750 [Citrus unshiu]